MMADICKVPKHRSLSACKVLCDLEVSLQPPEPALPEGGQSAAVRRPT